MPPPNTSYRKNILLLQSATRARWSILLDVPRLAPLIQAELRPLALSIRPLGSSFSEWIKCSAATAPGGTRARAIRELAGRLSLYDRLGRWADEIHDLTARALEDDHSASTLAHLESIRYIRRVQVELRNKLLVDGLELIDEVVRDMRPPSEWIADMKQDGVFGLLRAFERFEPTSGEDFRSFARWWIRRCILEARMRQPSTSRVSQGRLRRPHLAANAAPRRLHAADDAGLGIIVQQADDAEAPFLPSVGFES